MKNLKKSAFTRTTVLERNGMAGLYTVLQKAEPASSYLFTLSVACATSGFREAFVFVLCGYRNIEPMSHINASKDMDFIKFQLVRLSFEIWTWENWSNHPLETNQNDGLVPKRVNQITQKINTKKINNDGHSPTNFIKSSGKSALTRSCHNEDKIFMVWIFSTAQGKEKANQSIHLGHSPELHHTLD